MKKIDLHIHSNYSDGTDDVKNIILKAKELNLDFIAITDHNEYRSSIEAYNIDNEYVIPGVEIDALLDDINVHILAYNFDINNQDFLSFLDNNKNELFKLDDEFITCLINNGYNIDLNDYNNYSYNKNRGGWKALNYIIDKNICANLDEYFKLMNKLNYKHINYNFKNAKEVIDIIHKTNGIAIIAHPYKTFPLDKINYYLDILRSYNIDGIEVFYSNTPKSLEDEVYKYALKYNLITTIGNDYHGTFTKNILGYNSKDYQIINLNNIIKRS